jgi:hypothetical protein
MELPTEVRCQIYECLLLVPGATSYGTIFIEELKYRKNLRRLQQDGRESLPTELMRHIAKDYGLPDRDENYFDTLLDHNGQVKCLLHVDILRVNRQINEEAEDIFYGRNKVSIAPNLYKQNEPLHHQLTEGWIPSPIRYLQLELHESGVQGCELPIYVIRLGQLLITQVVGPQSRSYGIWGSFLHLPALRELRIVIHLCGTIPKNIDEDWDTSTFCAKTFRNIVAALPGHVKLIGVGEHAFRIMCDDGLRGKSRFATADEVHELYRQFEYIRGVDAEIWKTEMECTSEPPASPKTKPSARTSDGEGWAVV